MHTRTCVAHHSHTNQYIYSLFGIPSGFSVTKKDEHADLNTSYDRWSVGWIGGWMVGWLVGWLARWLLV